MIHNLVNSMKTETGKCFVSIILGIGLATLFRKSCESRNCMVFRSPPFEEIKRNVYRHDDKCFKFVEHSVSCDPKKNKQILIA